MTTPGEETVTAQAFAERVLAAFGEVGRWTDSQVGAAGGPSATTMTKLRAVARGEAEMAEPREPTWSKVDRAAGWAPGSARRLWRGLTPRAAGAPVAALPQRLMELRARVDELEALACLLAAAVRDVLDETLVEVSAEPIEREN